MLDGIFNETLTPAHHQQHLPRWINPCFHHCDYDTWRLWQRIVLLCRTRQLCPTVGHHQSALSRRNPGRNWFFFFTMLGSSGSQTSLCLFPNGRANGKGFEVCYVKSCEWLGSIGHRSGFFSTLHHSHKMCVLVAEDGVKVSKMDWGLHKAPYRLRRSFVTKVLRRPSRSHDEAALKNVLNPRMIAETLCRK